MKIKRRRRKDGREGYTSCHLRVSCELTRLSIKFECVEGTANLGEKVKVKVK